MVALSESVPKKMRHMMGEFTSNTKTLGIAFPVEFFRSSGGTDVSGRISRGISKDLRPNGNVYGLLILIVVDNAGRVVIFRPSMSFFIF